MLSLKLLKAYIPSTLHEINNSIYPFFMSAQCLYYWVVQKVILLFMSHISGGTPGAK